jgi:hypothetical protein
MRSKKLVHGAVFHSHAVNKLSQAASGVIHYGQVRVITCRQGEAHSIALPPLT